MSGELPLMTESSEKCEVAGRRMLAEAPRPAIRFCMVAWPLSSAAVAAESGSDLRSSDDSSAPKTIPSAALVVLEERAALA